MISLTDNLIVDVKIWNMIHETIRSLKAQLASSAEALTIAKDGWYSGKLVNDWYKNEDITWGNKVRQIIDSIPKTAALDAEILRAAKEWARDKACMSDKYLDPEDVVLRNAVRARKEAESDN